MRLTILLFLITNISLAQITSAQQKALNSYVDYANQSAREVTTMVLALKSYYASVSTQKSWTTLRFTCPVQPDTYYYNHALELNGNLPLLNTLLRELRVAADSIDVACKSLDTYYKLQDFKQDNHAKGEQMVLKFPQLLRDYRSRQEALNDGLITIFKKLSAGNTQNTYRKSDVMMRDHIDSERKFLSKWSLNLHEEIHSGWPDYELQPSISETNEHLEQINAFHHALKYPASSMWTSFKEALQSVLNEKRRGLDEYNFAAKKSDRHGNEVYLNLINYFNGTLVSSYNTFIQFSERDGYYGLKVMEYFPSFDIRTTAKNVEISIAPFGDTAAPAFKVTPKSSPISRPTFQSLINYVEFINEGTRQVRYLQMVLRNFNSSASYYRNLQSFAQRAAMTFDYEKFQVPLSLFQTLTSGNKDLPQEAVNSLNMQAQVLLDILKEMDQHAASIDVSVETKQYESDRLQKIFDHLERERTLMNEWDQRKEDLYNDVRKVYEAYPSSLQQKNPWYVSAQALWQLAGLDHTALFRAKAYYLGDSTIEIPTAPIDSALRLVITMEHDNMKGIEKLGRYNGMCPYSPYEDLPETSRIFSEKLQKVKEGKQASGRHPYEALIYDYNNIVDDFNKFAELSKEVLVLKMIHQPELFFVKDPGAETGLGAEISQRRNYQRERREGPVRPNTGPSAAASVKLIRDTVYIEKRDTVYISEPAEEMRSMEGYAINNMVLLLDVSGSMNSPEKLPLLKAAVLDMLSMMRDEDEIALIAFSGKPNVLLKPISFNEDEKIRKAINTLKSSGKTDAAAGIRLAYKVADENYIRGGNNRIILATDGEFAVDDKTRELIRSFAGQDIFLTVFDFGKGSGSSRSLEQLAKTGKGNYEHISKENAGSKLIHEAKSKRARQ